MEPWIEEKIELLNSYTEEFGEEEVSALMEQHQDGKREHQLQRFDQKYFHLLLIILIIDYTLLYMMHQFGGNAASLGIGLQIDVEIGLTVEGGFRHYLLYDVAHLQESTLATAEAGIDHLVGCIDDARHVATFPDSFESQAQTFELLVVGLKELQVLGLEQVETVALQRQALGEV